MSQANLDRKSNIYTAAVIVVGVAVWLLGVTFLSLNFSLRNQLILLMVVPLTVIAGMFSNTFPLPSALKASPEKLTFTISDAIVLLIACWYGLPAAVFVAGIEGFTSSRRTVRRLKSNLFSFAMMSLSAAVASIAISVTLRLAGSNDGAGPYHTFPTVAVALLLASIAHIVANTGLIATLFALRYGNSIMYSWRQYLIWLAPMFLPNSAAASLMYIALQHNRVMMVVIGAPILISVFFCFRQYRNSILERIASLQKAYCEMVEAFAVVINAKDEVTHDHVLRVQIYAAGVARLLDCTDLEIEALKAGSLLHDIGKIAVPDYILNKPGKLTATEFEKMKMHTIIGAQILGRVEFPYPIVPVVRHHHERWDGNGYPDGLAGDQIPLTARILSVVDCFDAVREDRQYRKGMTRDEALEFLTSNSGGMYDPRVIDTFIEHLPEFEAEIQLHRDSPKPSFGIEPVEELSQAARLVAPAAGLSEAAATETSTERADFSLEQLRGLHDLAKSLARAEGRDQIVTAFLERLRDVVSYDTCTAALPDEENGDFQITHAAGKHAGALIGREVMQGHGVVGWVLSNRHPFCNTDPKLDLPPTLAEQFAAYRTLAIFPIIKGTELFGAVALYSAELAKYDTEKQKLIEEATALLATALAPVADAAPAPAKLKADVQVSVPIIGPPSALPYESSPLTPTRT